MTRKIVFFEGWSWFKFNNLGLSLGTNLKFCTSQAKELKLKIRTFWGPNPTFVEVIGEKQVGGPFLASPILNRVKVTDDGLYNREAFHKHFFYYLRYFYSQNIFNMTSQLNTVDDKCQCSNLNYCKKCGFLLEN